MMNININNWKSNQLSSLLDHCIHTADVHNCPVKVEILYDVAMTDPIPVTMILNVKHWPESINHDNH